MPPGQAPPRPPLEEVYHFTAEALAANRAGHIVEGQTSGLWGTSILWGTLGILGILLGLAAIKYARGFMRLLGPTMGTIAGAALLGIVAHPALRDAMSPQVAVTEGPVLQQTSVGRNPGEAVLHFENVRVLTRGTWPYSKDAIERNTVYRAYYLPHTRRLLSIERIGPAAP